MKIIETTVLGRKTTARVMNLKRITNLENAYECPECSKEMFETDNGVYRCYLHGRFVQSFYSEVELAQKSGYNGA